MTESFYFQDSQGRGRNGWFKAYKAIFWVLSHNQLTRTKLFLEVQAKQVGHTSPIILELALSDATALGQRLIDTALQAAEQGGNP